MADYSALYQLETDYETAFQAILVAAGITNTYRSREGNDSATPWVEVRFLPGSVISGHRKSLTAGSKTRFSYTAYTGSVLSFEVVTHRKTNAVSHKTYLGIIRAEMQMYRLCDTWPEQVQSTTHAITDIRETGSQSSYNDEIDTDHTIISFSVMHSIRDDAF